MQPPGALVRGDAAEPVTVLYAGPTGAGRRSNLEALASLLVPEPLIEPGPEPFVLLPLRSNRDGREFTVRVGQWSLGRHGAMHDRKCARSLDALVFVADSSPTRFDANLSAFEQLVRAMRESDRPIETVPHVVQFNKRDLAIACAVCDLSTDLTRYGAESVEASSRRGRGALTTLVLALHAAGHWGVCGSNRREVVSTTGKR